jgi:5-methylcytosine-specific restriction endonuclease McrA
MNKDEYKQYLSSDQWLEIRHQILERASWQCEQCLSPVALEVHHLTYDRVGNEDLDDLQCLCHECHSAKHPDTAYSVFIRDVDLRRKQYFRVDMGNGVSHGQIDRGVDMFLIMNKLVIRSA